MEAINGVTFEDWGAASGNLAAGMPVEEVCEVLGIELPVWQKTNEEWTNKLGDLMAQDMNIATQYGGYFTNPKVGKFAGASAAISNLDSLLEKVPNQDTYQKIFFHQSIASEHGIDPTTIIDEYGFNLQEWSQLSGHYSKEFHSDMSDHSSPEYMERYREHTAIIEKWQKHWEEHYKNDSVDLGGDIDF